MTFVFATVHAYPGEQLSLSAANFFKQLMAFGLYGFDSSGWTLGEFDHVLPRARSSYLASRQARDILPLDLITSIQFWTIFASLATIAALVPFLWRRHSSRLAGLSIVILPLVTGNALVTGSMSVVDVRYGCRAMWLIPLLSSVFVLDWLH